MNNQVDEKYIEILSEDGAEDIINEPDLKAQNLKIQLENINNNFGETDTALIPAQNTSHQLGCHQFVLNYNVIFIDSENHQNHTDDFPTGSVELTNGFLAPMRIPEIGINGNK